MCGVLLLVVLAVILIYVQLHGGSYEMWKERYQNILAGEEPDVGDTSSDEDEEI